MCKGLSDNCPHCQGFRGDESLKRQTPLVPQHHACSPRSKKRDVDRKEGDAVVPPPNDNYRSTATPRGASSLDTIMTISGISFSWQQGQQAKDRNGLQTKGYLAFLPK